MFVQSTVISSEDKYFDASVEVLSIYVWMNQYFTHLVTISYCYCAQWMNALKNKQTTTRKQKKILFHGSSKRLKGRRLFVLLHRLLYQSLAGFGSIGRPVYFVYLMEQNKEIIKKKKKNNNWNPGNFLD